MKNLIFILMFIFINLNVVKAASSLYTSEEFAPLEINQMSEILKNFHQREPGKNILFYVHGRKKDVEKEWKNLTDLEKNFNVKIIMFHWPSWSGTTSRPVEAAEDASLEFGDALKEISHYKLQNAEEFTTKKISLLSHSMGNIIVSHYALNYYSNENFQIDNNRTLFDNYISSAPDTPMIGHKKWLSQINFAKNKYVTMNNGDSVLRSSYLLDIVKGSFLSYKLGLGFGTFSVRNFFIEKILDTKSIYIDLSKVLKGQHRHFQADAPWVNKIFIPLFNGRSINLDQIGVNYEHKRGIYYVKE